MSKMDFGRIGVIAGGPSSERDISLKTGEAVFNSLKSEGHNAVFLDVREDIRAPVKDAGLSVAFIALHGRFGEDGTVQAILDDMNIPYTGSGVSASRLALDKIASKEIFEKNGIPVPGYAVFEKDKKNSRGDMRFPLVVKPQNEGSSVGLSIVENEKQLNGALDKAFVYDNKVILEDFIRGKELTVGILGLEALPAIQIITGTGCYDYAAKYERTDTQYLVPAPVYKKYYEKALELALAAHNSLGCQVFSRVDMILDEKANFFVLEVNTIPGMTARSLLPKAAQAAGIPFYELCVKIIELSLMKEESGMTSRSRE